jgi:hypothetical protein
MSTNEHQAQSGGLIGDQVALAIQQLRPEGRLGQWDTLLRIDNQTEAAEAPFQFDAVNGALHRKGCKAIPAHARSALYGLQRIGPEEQKRACPRCRPVQNEQQTEPENDRADLLFGLISVVDQFSGVLKERGKDFKKSSEGQKLNAQLGGLYQTLGKREKEVLDTVFTSLDQIAKRLRDLDSGLNGSHKKDD